MNKQANASTSPTSRRAVLAGAAGVAAAGVLSTTSLAMPEAGTVAVTPSAELLAWREARAAYWAADSALSEYRRSWERDQQIEIVPIGPVHESERDREGRHKVLLNAASCARWLRWCPTGTTSTAKRKK